MWSRRYYILPAGATGDDIANSHIPREKKTRWCLGAVVTTVTDERLITSICNQGQMFVVFLNALTGNDMCRK